MSGNGFGVLAVVKVGGGLLRRDGDLERVTAQLASLAHVRRLLVVPGGGPFADTVRAVDERVAIDRHSAHWMAVLAMDQYAHLVASRVAGALLVEQPPAIRAALAARRLPVLAPSRWLRAVDPLPHGWEVTSDSIAAWVAGAVGAPYLVLVKPVDGEPEALTDRYWQHALPRDVTPIVLTPETIGELAEVVSGAGTPVPRRR